MPNSPLADPQPWNADALSLYQKILPVEFFEQVRKQTGIRQNNRVYVLPVVMWLMITQRLASHGSLESAVLELLRGLPANFWPQPCKRLQDWQQNPQSLSSHTGAYNKARQGLPLTVVEQSCDRIFQQLLAYTGGGQLQAGQRIFFFDGTSVRLAHREELRQLYPPGSNQQGEAHWPLLRMLVAHDLETGLAMRPQWGPMHGSQAVSEQQLLESSIDRLPGGSVVAGDANFGVFSVAWAAVRHGHPALLRLTEQRARRLAGGLLQDGTDRKLDWKPSRDDRRNHPDWPPDAAVRGRLIVRQVQPDDGSAPFLLPLFTTLEGEVVPLYGQRWNIETDLRSLKSTLELDQLDCTTSEMVAKELDLAIAAYNLVRAVTFLAAQKAGIPPRAYSFTRARTVVQTFAPLLATAKDAHQAQQYFDRMMYYIGQATLPKRSRKRPSYPRAVWPTRAPFPNRKA
jgi:DDE family transposase